MFPFAFSIKINLSSIHLQFISIAGPLPSIKFVKGKNKSPIVPGVCIIDEKYKFYFNKTLSDGTTNAISLFYQCGMKRATQCPSSVGLHKLDDCWWPQDLSGDEIHNHASDKAFEERNV